MIYEILFLQEAVDEVAFAYNWYEEQRGGLGFDLLQEIDTCLQKLKIHPQHYTYINSLYRRIRLNRFPYYLIYEIEESKILINSFYHVKQNDPRR